MEKITKLPNTWRKKKGVLDKIKQQRSMFQSKEQDKTPGEEVLEVEISNLLEKEFKVIIVKMLKQLGKRMDEHHENFNKEL